MYYKDAGRQLGVKKKSMLENENIRIFFPSIIQISQHTYFILSF